MSGSGVTSIESPTCPESCSRAALVARAAPTVGDAIARALTRDRATCAAYAKGFTWEASARQFLNALVPIGLEEDEAA